MPLFCISSCPRFFAVHDFLHLWYICYVSSEFPSMHAPTKWHSSKTMVSQHSPGLYSVLYEFEALENGEVSVQAGQLVEVRDIENEVKYEGWTLVRFTLGTANNNTSLVVGFVPTNYLVPYNSGTQVCADGDKETIIQMDERNIELSNTFSVGTPGNRDVRREREMHDNNVESLDDDTTLGATQIGSLVRGFKVSIYLRKL